MAIRAQNATMRKFNHNSIKNVLLFTFNSKINIKIYLNKCLMLVILIIINSPRATIKNKHKNDLKSVFMCDYNFINFYIIVVCDGI